MHRATARDDGTAFGGIAYFTPWLTRAERDTLIRLVELRCGVQGSEARPGATMSYGR